jgi:hypothetical protein
VVGSPVASPTGLTLSNAGRLGAERFGEPAVAFGVGGMLDGECRMPDAECRMPDYAGWLMLDAGLCRMADAGWRMRAVGVAGRDL